jgi:hypothetical protein
MKKPNKSTSKSSKGNALRTTKNGTSKKNRSNSDKTAKARAAKKERVSSKKSESSSEAVDQETNQEQSKHERLYNQITELEEYSNILQLGLNDTTSSRHKKRGSIQLSTETEAFTVHNNGKIRRNNLISAKEKGHAMISLYADLGKRLNTIKDWKDALERLDKILSGRAARTERIKFFDKFNWKNVFTNDDWKELKTMFKDKIAETEDSKNYKLKEFFSKYSTAIQMLNSHYDLSETKGRIPGDVEPIRILEFSKDSKGININKRQNHMKIAEEEGDKKSNTMFFTLTPIQSHIKELVSETND